jgi:hypothetical protein
MSCSSVSLSLGSEFDEFLYAPIVEDSRGMCVSVISALARLDLDPWKEAAELAQLPKEIATRKLTSLIARLPDCPASLGDASAIAACLVDLLPRRTGIKSASREQLIGDGALTSSPTVIALVYVIFWIFILSLQYVAATHLPPARFENPDASNSTLALPLVAPPSSSPDDRRSGEIIAR